MLRNFLRFFSNEQSAGSISEIVGLVVNSYAALKSGLKLRETSAKSTAQFHETYLNSQTYVTIEHPNVTNPSGANEALIRDYAKLVATIYMLEGESMDGAIKTAAEYAVAEKSAPCTAAELLRIFPLVGQKWAENSHGIPDNLMDEALNSAKQRL